MTPDRPRLDRVVSVPTRRPGVAPPAVDVDGVDIDGAPRRVGLAHAGHRTLLLFLGARCDGCRPFWASCTDVTALGLAPDDVVVVVTRAAPQEDPDELRLVLSGKEERAALVMSEAVWSAYRVLGPPFFVLVDGARVVTEGVAWSVEQVASDVRRARGSLSPAGGGRPAGSDATR